MESIWNEFYKRPLDEIPWHNTQADWFCELVDNGAITGNIAIDLGCGVGAKSIYLAKHTNFNEILGVDISEEAISIAKNLAIQEKVQDKCDFVVGDISKPLTFKEDKKLDFILDWATLHTVPEENYDTYIDNINKISHKDTILLLRVFSTDDDRKYFEEQVGDFKVKAYFFDEGAIKKLFSNFSILDKRKSLPKTKKDMFFLEFLMQKNHEK